MPRVSNSPAHLKRRNRVLKAAKGYVAGRSKLYRTAKAAVQTANQYAFSGRKEKKQQYRALWITRISGALWQKKLNYSQFIHGLKLAKIDLNRKMLSELAINDPSAFDQLVETAQKALEQHRVAHAS
jgi:large subunit ribosomal protein L20